MNPIPICHVSTVHRGVEIRIIRKELASLAEAGYQAHAIIAATPDEVAEAATLGITLHPLEENAQAGGRLTRMTRKMYSAWRACRKLDARLYHFHDPELIPLGLALKLAGYKVVMDVHEDLASQVLTKHWIPAPLRTLVARLSRMAERFGARFYDGVVTASPRQAAFFEDVARRVTVAHNYPLLSELAVDMKTAEAAAGTPASPTPRTHVVYVGGISRIRGINEAIDAVEQADVRLVLAGRFKTEAERQEAASRPGWSRVEYLGWVDRQGIQQALTRSFAGLCTLHPTPNHLNAEPIKLFEYMAAAIPSIVSTIPDWMPYVQKHDAGICVDPMDTAAIATAIRQLRDDPERARQMGENGRRAVLEHYNWNTQAERLKKLYQEVLSP